MPRCHVTLQFDGQEEPLIMITDDYDISLQKKVNKDGQTGDAYFVIHGFLADG